MKDFQDVQPQGLAVPTITSPPLSSPTRRAARGVGVEDPFPPLPLERPEANDRLERCVRIWGLAHRGVWFYPEAMREVMYVEQGLPLCESCRLRSGTINDRGIRVCGSCKNMPNGDDIDREWSRYKEEGP